MNGLGSGVLISKDGKVLTAAHLVQPADKIEVEFPDGEVAFVITVFRQGQIVKLSIPIEP